MSSAAKKLPLHNVTDSNASPKPTHEWNYRILVVEDERAIADTYRDIFDPTRSNVVPLMRSSRTAARANAPEPHSKEMQYELSVARTADEAIALIKHGVATKKPFTMGFFDVLLGPGMDGVELVKCIRELQPDIYAVFVTAHNDRSVDSIQAFLGPDSSTRWDYVNKPFSIGEIKQKARNAVTVWNLQKEKELREAEHVQLRERLSERERYSSVETVSRGFTHEFGNLLAQIMGKAELSLQKDPETMRESMEIIFGASKRAADILNRFKHFSNTGSHLSERHWASVNDLMNEAVELLQHQISKNQVKVCRIRNQNVRLKVDSTAMVQVFLNLMINAIHAMPPNGQIDISIAPSTRVELPSCPGKPCIEIRIRDYGPGVSKENLPRLSEAFFTTKGKKGTGLGLAVCKQIIELDHEGLLVLGNHGIKGFEAVITLPIHNEEEEGEHNGN